MQKMLSLTRRCADDYNMLGGGDKIAVGVSGGKDSLTALYLLSKLACFHPAGFTVSAITLDMGYEGTDYSGIVKLCEELGVAYTVVPTEIKKIVFDIRREQNPCSLCANLRRGALYAEAKRQGCNKVALGHHEDDAVETFIMSLFYESRISCFSPVTYLDRSDITLIRPLLYLTERDITGFARRYSLPVLHNPCPANGNTKRQEAKELVRTLALTKKDIRERVFSAMCRLPLEGWQPTRPPRSRKATPPPDKGGE